MRLKVKIDDINFVIEKKPMILYHVNGLIRYADQLDKGLFDITINPNYVRESPVPNLQIKKEVLDIQDFKG